MERRNRTKVLIADDHKMVADACKHLLEPEFEVIGIVSDGRSLLKAVDELLPNIVVLDIAMPNLNGLDAGEKIKLEHREIKLIYLTMNKQPEVAAEAFRRGASGYVLKQCSASELITAIRKVTRRETYLSTLLPKDTVQFLLRSDTRLEENRVSLRQREVLQLLAEGKSMKEVADVLQVKSGTVAFHKYTIMRNLDIKTNAELLVHAIKHNMVA